MACRIAKAKALKADSDLSKREVMLLLSSFIERTGGDHSHLSGRPHEGSHQTQRRTSEKYGESFP
jgi:hypothetical protein